MSRNAILRQTPSGIRITSSGLYYLYYLINSFAYLDLVWQDTPFHERGMTESMSRLIRHTNMTKRFERVDRFIECLRKEEEAELYMRGLNEKEKDFWGSFIPKIVWHYKKEKNYIKKKLQIS